MMETVAYIGIWVGIAFVAVPVVMVGLLWVSWCSDKILG